jgi:DNA-binding winged helix-turn-helix (wHTH) protein
LPVEQTKEPLVTAPVSQSKQKIAVVSRPSIQIDMAKTDMVDILRSLDFSIEDYPYIPKSIDFEEMVEAVHLFALGNTDCFERSTKVIEGVEHPQTGRWVYVGATIDQPRLVSRFSTVAEWNAIVQKTLGYRELIVEETPKIIPSDSIQKDTAENCPTHVEQDTGPIIKSGFSFIEERAVPYKPWTLNIGGERYHLSGADKNVVEHLLNATEPQSKDDLALAEVSFTGQMQGKLKEIGLLEVYKKDGVARKTFYAIATEHYNPTYEEFYKRGETRPNTEKPASKTVSNVPKPKPDNPNKTSPPTESTISIGALVITPSKNTVTYEGEVLSHVASKPYEALVLMAKKHGDFVTKEELSMHFFGNADDKSVAQIDRGIKGLGSLIDKSVPNLSQSLIMKVGDKGYALTLSIEDRHIIYNKAGIKNPLKVTRPKFAPPTHHQKGNGHAKDAMNGQSSPQSKKPPQQQGGGRRSMAEQLAQFKIN